MMSIRKHRDVVQERLHPRVEKGTARSISNSNKIEILGSVQSADEVGRPHDADRGPAGRRDADIVIGVLSPASPTACCCPCCRSGAVTLG